jgi:hypothetical protein
MNIFLLDENPQINAQYHCDKHVVKMILETAQLLCSANHLCGDGDPPYKLAHKNHPVTKWVRASYLNYLWLLDLVDEMHKEWQFRYGDKIHKSYIVAQFLR